MFLFSSKVIPGNERGVLRIMNNFSEMGVDVVDDRNGLYHVSGHANRPDLEAIHDLMKPAMIIPMHGEHRHLREHAKIAEEKGITTAIVTNGMLMDITGDAPKVAERIETGRVYLDGSALIGAMDGVVRDRIRMALNGHALVTVLIDEQEKPLGEPWVEIMGLPETGRGNRPLVDTLEADLTEYLDRASAKVVRDDDKLDEDIRRVVRQSAENEVGKKPEVTVVISRLMAG